VAMQLPTEDREEIIKRLKRVEGQLRGLQAMVDEGRECNDTLIQFAAANRALSKAGYRFFAATMEQCRLRPDEANSNGYTAEALEKMFLRLG
jgi:DNA-binding FrmR family transcriptional regulator